MFEKGAGGRSQSNEDAIIAGIFARIGEGEKRFVEFGCGDGRQNNTIALLLRGWHGLWFEPHKKRCLSAKKRWEGYPVEIRRRVITPEKVNVVVRDPIDFLSIDIDGGDYAVWQALEAHPRVVCIEYGEQPPGKHSAHPIALEHIRQLGYEKGYRLAGLSESNVNAFFVRDTQ